MMKMTTKKNKAEVQAKSEAKPETKKEPVAYSRIQSIADAMKAGATFPEKIIADADRLYNKKTGRGSNPARSVPGGV